VVLLWGAYALVDGVLDVVAGLRTSHDHRWALLIEGVTGIAAGVATFAWPGRPWSWCTSSPPGES
jgi:uncharacterized membrane protein HdeD (DUF308 family)